MSDLKPCPFCAQDATIYMSTNEDYCSGKLSESAMVECKSCHVATPDYKYAKQAISHWNRRTVKK